MTMTVIVNMNVMAPLFKYLSTVLSISKVERFLRKILSTFKIEPAASRQAKLKAEKLPRALSNLAP